MRAGIALCIELRYRMHEASAVPLLNKVHRMKSCFSAVFFSFSLVKNGPSLYA